MKYVTLGKSGLKVSTLGFGCMRIPNENNVVNRDLATPLLRKAVDLGVNFFDSAYGYMNGDSEEALGEAIEDIREKVIISTKNPHHNATKDEWRAALELQLKRLRTDYIDIYNHHFLSLAQYDKTIDPEKDGLLTEMLKAKEEGLVRHIGFSSHDTPENIVKLAQTGYFETLICQYNLLDRCNEQTMATVKELGLGVIVMGPVGGGRLGLPSEKISELTDGKVTSTPEAALRFVWGNPNVDVALSGMSTMEQLEDNIRIESQTKAFEKPQVENLISLVEDRKKKMGFYCTGCGYCLPCPKGVKIPGNLDLLMWHDVFGIKEVAKDRYKPLEGKAADCVNCGVCVEKCPQKIDIPKRMKQVDETLS